jgi:hypothetical protein
MAAYFAYVYARWVYAHLFNMFALYSFGSALEFWEVKVLFFYISCGLGAALMHTGINYYYFNDAINTLAANGFLRGSSSAFKSRKNKHTMAGAIDRVAISKFH